MSKVAVVAISDVHADWKTYGRARFDEISIAIRRSVVVARERKADLWCFTGDWCNPDSGTSVFRCVELMIETAMALSDAGIRNVWLPGNHDVIEDGSGDTALSPLRALKLAGSSNNANSILCERPRSLRLGNVFVHALPFTATSHAYDAEAHVRAIEIPDAAKRLPQLVLSHLTRVEGITPGEEASDMSRGREVALPRLALRDRFAELGARQPFVLQGHFHKRQRFASDDGLPVVQVVGAPAQFTHGEESHDPGFVVVELDAA